MTETLLVISDMGVPLYSARGLTQTLAPIAAAGNLRRAINGQMLDFSHSQFQLYSSKISCNDQRSPAIDGVWPGKVVTVDCVVELCYQSSGTPARTPVAASTRTEGDFVFYRPQLTMMVVGGPQIQLDEYGAAVGWSLDLEELGG